MKPFLNKSYLALIILAGLVFAGCGKANFTTSTSSDWNINGHRTITRTRNGVTQKLDSATDIDIHNGHITKFSPGALVKLEERGGSEQRLAELRDRGGRLELWISENGIFRKGSAEDDAWQERFLTDITLK